MKNTEEIVEQCKLLVKKGWTPVKDSRFVSFVPPTGRFSPEQCMNRNRFDPVTSYCCEWFELDPVQIEDQHEHGESLHVTAGRLLGIDFNLLSEVTSLGWDSPLWKPIFDEVQLPS